MSRFTRPGVVAGASLLTAAALVTAIASGAIAATMDDVAPDAPVVAEAPAPAPAPEAPAPEAPAPEAPAPEAPAPEAPAPEAPASAPEAPAPATEEPAEQVDDAETAAPPTANAGENEEFPNTAPVAQDDDFTMNEDETFVGTGITGLFHNDFDPDVTNGSGSAFQDVIFKRFGVSPGNGSFTISDDGSFTFTPKPNFAGDVVFSYIATDGRDESNLATVTIHVLPVLDVVAQDDEYVTAEDTAFSVSGDDVVIFNDSVDGLPISPADNDVLLITPTTHGTLSSVAADGTFTYTPDAGFTGTDSFVYIDHVGNALSNNATVTITVEPTVGEPGDGDDGDDLPTLPDPGTDDPTSAPVPPVADTTPAGDPVENLAFTGGPDGFPGLLFAAILLLVGLATLIYALVNRRRYIS